MNVFNLDIIAVRQQCALVKSGTTCDRITPYENGGYQYESGRK